MFSSSAIRWIVAALLFQLLAAVGLGQQSGSISGTVSDADFEAPLAGARVEIVETRQAVETGPGGTYRFPEVAPGAYTLVFAKSGYSRQVAAQVAVLAGEVTTVDRALEGDFVEMSDFVVEPVVLLGGASELGLLNQRLDAPSLTDSIGAELIRGSGSSSADQALRLIPGATVSDDATPVVRGLPDRYVPSLVNGVRLPSSNEDKRAVELDQFPAAVIESIEISKTATPDNQGDGSGGVVDIVLKSVPDEPLFSLNFQRSYNTQVTNDDGFLSYDDGGVGDFGRESGERGPQSVGENWDGAVGVSPIDAPTDFKLSTAVGGSHELDGGTRIGGFFNLFYEKDSSFFRGGQNDSWWLRDPSEGLIPQIRGSGSVAAGDFQTALFDVSEATRFVQWGGLASAGIEFENNQFGLTYLYSHLAEDTATLAIDQRGKQFYFPNYDPNDPAHPGNLGGSFTGVTTAPWLRTQTLEYTERTTGSLQLNGSHEFEIDSIELGESFKFENPELDWVLSSSFADLDQPDKRLFGEIFRPRSFDPSTGEVREPFFESFRPADNVNLGNLQRIYKTIEEESTQGALDLKLPFEQWTGTDGYLKFGAFEDRVDRAFVQDNYSNGLDPNTTFFGSFESSWASNWQNENHLIEDQLTDVDYDGQIDISAWYSMFDMPISESFKVVGGVRVESTDVDVDLTPEAEALWVPPGGTSLAQLEEGQGDARFSSNDALPSLSAIWEAAPGLTLRGAYSKTIARQTFKELVPIVQQEFLGGPIFIGNPGLELARLDNYDLRLDYKPTDDTFLSASYFFKDIEKPIENIQQVVNFGFTTPVNYPDGELSGFEFEARQGLGLLSERLEGLRIGANATIIDSEVSFPDSEIALFAATGVGFDERTRDATNAPEYLYNLYATYEIDSTQTQFGLFYTVQGDTLVAGDSTSQNNYIPAVYQKEFGTLNASIGQRLSEHWSLRIQAKNITNPTIEEVYRSPIIDGDTTRNAFTRGVEYSISIGASFAF